MNKKLKLAIPFAVLALSCGVAAGCAGCNPGKHQHSYTQWEHDESYHWKVCPEDGEIDESSKEEHVFIAGVCDECGATQQTAEYGSVTGTVKLYKQGEYITDALSNVRVDMGDDDVEVTGNVADGKYSFEVSNVQINKSYTLTVSCEGYQKYSTEIFLEENGEEAIIGGSNGITLKYEVFKFFWGYDEALHDLSNVNEENPTIGLDGDGGKTLNVISTDKYGDVSVTIRAKSSNAGVIQGLLMKFEDGKAAIFNLKTDQSLVQFRPKTQGTLSIFDPTDQDIWKESPAGSVTDTEKAKFNGDGIDVTLTRKGGTLYAFLDGRYVYSIDLPAGYEDDQINVGLFAYDVKANALFSYDISDEVPEMQSTLNIDVTKPDGIDCTVTAEDPAKSVYAFDEDIKLTFTAPTGYKLDALTVGGEDMLSEVANGTLTIKANRVALDVCATFVVEEPIALDLSVKGKKLGTTAALADGTIVKFKGTEYSFTVAGGKISAASVLKGRYTVQVDGYFEQQITFDENLSEITLEYDLFKVLRWDTDAHILSHVNDENPYVEFNGSGASLNVVTKQNTLNNAAVSVTIKSNYTTNGDQQQGLILVFEDGKAAILNINTNGTPRLQFRPELFSETSDASLGLHTAFSAEWVEFKNVTSAEVAKYQSEGIVLTVAREGNLLYLFIDGVYHGTATLPEQYSDDKMGFGLFGFDVVNGNKWYFEVSETLPDMSVTLTDNTAEEANGSVATSTNNKLGETVTITVTPGENYMLDTITVTDGNSNVVEVTAAGNNTYTFVAMEKNYTVTATFKSKPAKEAEAAVTGIGLNADSVDMSGKEITFKTDGGTETKFTVSDTGNVKGVLAAGEYTVSCEGFYDLTATVNEDGSFAQDTNLEFSKIIFEHDGIGEPQANLDANGFIGIVADSSTAASEGKISVSEKGSVYEWTVDEYKDVAVSFTFKKKTEEQGIMMLVANQKVISVRLQDNNGNPKMQWLGNWYDAWFWGTQSAINTFDFGSGEDYLNPLNSELLAKYSGEGLKVTLLRKGGMLYVLVDGKLCTAHILGQYANNSVKFGLFVKDTEGAYDIPFEIDTNVDAILNAAMDTTNNVMGVLGNWMVTDTTLAVSGNGYVEVAPMEEHVKEALSINISSSNATKQGLTYRFADGKWLGFRYEPSYIQYTQDIIISGDDVGRLKGWTTIYNLTEDEKTAFAGDGITLSLVRDGKYIYVMLGENVIDKVIMGDEYATMDGVIAATVEGGKGTAFSYEYKTGDGVVVPQVYAVTASFDGSNYGYAVQLDKNFVPQENGKVTLTIHSDPYDSALGWSSWSRFPSKITVNGVETVLTIEDFVSDGANKLHCTKEFTITADTEIKVTIAAGTTIPNGVVVSVKDEVGGTATSDSGVNGYYWNDACTLYLVPADGYEIASITIDDGEAITSGWTYNEAESRWEYTIADPIQSPINVVVEFRLVTTTEGGDAGDATTDTSAE